MIEFVAMNRKVNIDLEPGLYNFHPDSATEKTLLVKMMKSIGEKDKIAITYHDMLMGLDLEKIIAGKHRKIHPSKWFLNIKKKECISTLLLYFSGESLMI